MSRPLGLCWGCYYTPGVRSLYPSESRYARRGVGNGTGERPLPAEPTAERPGTLGKIRVMRGRAERGENLFHPGDNREVPEKGVRVLLAGTRDETVDDGWLEEAA